MKYIKIFLFTIINSIIFISLLSVLNYYDLINLNLYTISKLIILMIIFIINGYLFEKCSYKKFISNIFISLFIIFFLLLFNFIFYKVSYRLFIYILIIVLSNFLGGFIFRKKKNGTIV